MLQWEKQLRKCSPIHGMVLDILIKEVLDQFNASGSTSGDPCAAPLDVQTSNDDLLRNARLKKKTVRTKSSLRPRTWLDKKQKGRIRTQKKTKVCCQFLCYIYVPIP